MSFTPLSQPWPSNRALILVHGIGDYSAASYEPLLAALKAAVGADAWAQTAVYPLVYEQFNDMMAAKLSAAAELSKVVEHLTDRFGGDDIGKVAAEYAGDVIWPVLAVDARSAIRDAILEQLGVVVRDGHRAGVRRSRARISIVAHSLGCFHVYEALSAAATDERYRLQPGTDGAQFESVVLMASPVQLIRSVAKRLGKIVPSRSDLYCLGGETLALPGQVDDAEDFIPSMRKLVSLTGTLDPVGGYLLRRRLGWAYMEIPEQLSIIDEQAQLQIEGAAALRDALNVSPRTDGSAPPIPNPHDWVGYVARNATDLQEWLG